MNNIDRDDPQPCNSSPELDGEYPEPLSLQSSPSSPQSTLFLSSQQLPPQVNTYFTNCIKNFDMPNINITFNLREVSSTF